MSYHTKVKAPKEFLSLDELTIKSFLEENISEWKRFSKEEDYNYYYFFEHGDKERNLVSIMIQSVYDNRLVSVLSQLEEEIENEMNLLAKLNSHLEFEDILFGLCNEDFIYREISVRIKFKRK